MMSKMVKRKIIQITVCTVFAVLIVFLAGCRQDDMGEAHSATSSESEAAGNESESAGDSGSGESKGNDATISDALTENESSGDALTTDALLEAHVEEVIAGMTTEEKVAQMFFVTPESITGVETVTAAGTTTKAALTKYPVGGIIYLKQNLVSTSQTTEMLANMQSFAVEISGFPIFLAVDEEGGTVRRISGNDGFSVEDIGQMAEIGATGDTANAYETGRTIGTYLSELGFNLDFAPVADVLTNPENTVIGSRAFGSDSALVKDMVLAEMEGLSEGGVLSCVKHFPGHGGTTADTHKGYAYTNQTLEELRSTELVPFAAAIEADVPFVMVAHISLPNVCGDDTPASLSKTIVTDLLREEMGYDGIVITDAMNMGAISENYTAAQAVLLAVDAGVDMILMSSDFNEAYNALLEAVEDGRVSAERLDASVRRILRVKLSIQQ